MAQGSMSIFAPVYRPTRHRQTVWSKQQRLESRKRKRGDDSIDEDDALTTPVPRAGTTDFHPVNLKDPYYIAQHAREDPLPPPPFPHAAVKETKPVPKPIDEELAALNPPLYVPSAGPADKSTSSRRRHLDNLATILHTCMLRGDWQRAYRAWSLLIRTEIAGRGVDVRRNGRWGIGAEILMREQSKTAKMPQRPTFDEEEDGDSSTNELEGLGFSDQGFKLAREYYERLIVQYPYTRSSMHTFNATTVYPALFSVWIYEVQDRSKRGQSRVSTTWDFDDGNGDAQNNADVDRRQREAVNQVRLEELQQARAIEKRIDDLCLSPPYDTDPELRRLRDMVATWRADLDDSLNDGEVQG